MGIPLTSKKLNKTIKWLAQPTSLAWLQQAVENPLVVLIDHAHCERKAAGVAIQLMFRYPCEPGLAEALSPLAREELEHFERVISLIQIKGQSLKLLPAPPYGAALAKEIRKGEPERMLDSFLVSGLIEARSHERMSLLAIHSLEEQLRQLYTDLLASEARHFCIYWRLAEERFGRDATVSRLEELAKVESAILESLHPEPRMHS